MPVIIGMDPHKRSATIEVINERGEMVTIGKFGTDQVGYGKCSRLGAVSLIGYGRLRAATVSVGMSRTGWSTMVKLCWMCRRSCRRRCGCSRPATPRKTDSVDAHSVALVALRTPNLVRVHVDPELIVMSMLVDRRDELGRVRTQTVNRLHRLLLELFPGGAKKFLSATQARALVATIKPRDLVGKTRRRLTVELIAELEIIDKKMKAAGKDLRELVIARGSTLLDLHGIGPSSAARLLADVGDIHRFANRDRFASWNGTAPLDASSGEQQRHRLSRAGNRRINRTLHIMGVVQLRNPTAGRAYFDSKKAAGKASMEAMRALLTARANDDYDSRTSEPFGLCQHGASWRVPDHRHQCVPSLPFGT